MGIKKYYAGIGSRKTPPDILEFMTKIATYLSNQKYILRSGGADGADSAFEDGVINNLKKIYLPWPGFNKSEEIFVPLSKEAFELSEKYHPTWKFLSQGAKKLHTRNCYQVFGEDLKSRSEFIICWTVNGKITGGTGQALRIAQDSFIKIYNLAIKEDYDYWKEKIGE